MRTASVRPWLALLVIVFLVPAVPAYAQEDAEGEDAFELLEHVNPRQIKIPPGKERVYDLVFEGGAFTSGWLFLFNGKDVSGEVEVSFLYLEEDGSEREVRTWTYGDGEYRLESTLMPWDGFYRLRITSTGDEDARFVFFYDQSCNCAAKPIPVELPQGMVVFNVDIQEGSTWRAVVPEPPVHTLRSFIAVRLDDRSIFPEDFGQVVESTQAVNVDGRPVHVLEWTAKETRTFYLFTHAVRSDFEKVDQSDPPYSMVQSVMIIPSFERLQAAPEEAPAPAGLVPVAFLAALAMAVARRRR